MILVYHKTKPNYQVVWLSVLFFIESSCLFLFLIFLHLFVVFHLFLQSHFQSSFTYRFIFAFYSPDSLALSPLQHCFSLISQFHFFPHVGRRDEENRFGDIMIFQDFLFLRTCSLFIFFYVTFQAIKFRFVHLPCLLTPFLTPGNYRLE